MKILQTKPGSQAGSVLLVSLIITAVLGLTLASYLIMTQQQNQSVMRSQTWNSAIVMSEAGVEDALAMLNKFNSNFEKLTNWSSSSSIYNDNWAAIGANTYYVRRYINDSYYDVYITNVNNKPVINSLGFTPWHYNGGTAPQQTYAAVGGVSQQASVSPMTSRSVNVGTRIDPLVNVAMAALEQIDFNGNNVQTDSFDSSNPLYNDNGGYPAAYPNRQRDQGDVVTDLAIINSLNVGNAKIKGSAKTGPNGTLGIGPNGSVGDKAWVEGGNKGVQPGHFADDMNVLFPPVQLPSTSWSPLPTSGSGVVRTDIVINGSTITTNTATYNFYINGDGDYYVGTLDKPLHVKGHARLLITTKLALNGANDRIMIAPTNSSLRIYMQGATAAIGGKGIINASGNANNFYFFGLPNNSKLTFGGNASFTGVIYAPSAEFALGGGGSDDIDFIGASVTKTVKMNGHYKFHFDEALRNNGMGRGYIPTSWKEM